MSMNMMREAAIWGCQVLFSPRALKCLQPAPSESAVNSRQEKCSMVHGWDFITKQRAQVQLIHRTTQND